MNMKLFLHCAGFVVLLASVTAAQDAGPAGSGRKRVVTYSGILKYDSGMPRVGIVGLTLSLYAEQEGGDPLWRESQTVQTDEEGRYTVLLGATDEEGLPLEFFSSGRAQWLGLQVQGEEEQARVLLVTVPYALKAADADTVGGKPLSSLVLYEDLEKAAGKSIPAAAIVVQNGVSLGRSGASGTGENLGARNGQGAKKLKLSAGNSPVASNETGSNTWFGEGAGASITTGTDNSFFGYAAGGSNTGICCNSYFGSTAGQNNTGGIDNSFFGYASGRESSSGHDNSFFGAFSGWFSTGSYNSFFGKHAGSVSSGEENSFFGWGAGYSNTTGNDNAFVGLNAGVDNTTGWYNSSLGVGAGSSNTTGWYNSSVGAGAGAAQINRSGSYNSYFGAFSAGAEGITNATAIGCRAKVSQSNSLVLGSINGVNDATSDTNVGIGTTTPAGRLHIKGGSNELFYVGNDANIGIGTVGPDKRVQIVGTAALNATLHIGGTGDAAKDIFAGMGEDVDIGPAFDYGYAGYSFGRSAGFFNVRPDPSAVAPNPSLRFMTANQQRMIITNTGNVGIGTTSPKTGLQADNGAVYIGSPGEGIILRSPDGLVCVKLTVSNVAALVSTPMACP
jgi:hypothetical protein